MTDPNQSITKANTLYQFFRDELAEAFDDLGLTPREETNAYLVHLLDRFARLDDRRREAIGFGRPAALMLADALQGAGDDRIEAYRQLGDTSLFSCGFFEAYLNRPRALVNANYYRDMGKNAYAHVESLMEFKAPGGSFHRIFDELTRQFDGVVAAFQRIAGEFHHQRVPSLDPSAEDQLQAILTTQWWKDTDGQV